MLASTAGFAALMFGDTTLVDDNGAPVAKVIIPEMGASSDAVAGGLIAGKMLSEAYKSEELSAQLVGEATCTGAPEGEGTCTISNELVQLEITVPGAVAEGTYTWGSLIGDFLNRRLLDREDNVGLDTDAAYPLTTSDTSDNANPFTDNTGGGSIGPNQEYFYRVDGNMFSPLQTQTLDDEDAAKSYTEEQFIWIDGYTTYDGDEEDIVAYTDFIAYSLKFSGSGNDYSIPVCTTPENGNYDYWKYGDDGNID